MTKYLLTRPGGPWTYQTLGFTAANGAILDGALSDPVVTTPPDVFWTVYAGGSAESGVTRFGYPYSPSQPQPETQDGYILRYDDVRNGYYPASATDIGGDVADDLAAAVASAEAARDDAVDISGISTSDAVVEALVLDTGGAGPLTSAALSATLVLPSWLYSARTVLFIGDSITNGSNSINASTHGFPAVVSQVAGTAYVLPIVSGHVGERSDQIVTYLQADLDANPTIQHVHVQVGTNDAGQFRTLTQFQTAILEFYAICRRNGRSLSFGLIPPRPAAATTIDPYIRRYNLWLSQWCRLNDIPCADTFGALADPATGFFRAEYDDDGTHPNQAGHRAMAIAIAPVVLAKARRYLSRDMLVSPLGLVANPLMAGTTGWSHLGTTGAGVYTRSNPASELGDGLGFGAWHRVLLDNSGGGSSSSSTWGHVLDATKYSAGDVLVVTGRVNHSGSAGGSTLISFRNDSANVSFPGRAPVEIPMPGPTLAKATVPASPGTLRICHSVNAPIAGTVDSHLGECQVLNLTTGGLVDAF